MKYISLICAIAVYSCTNKNAKEPAIGAPGKINIIMTPEQWDGSVGRNLDDALTQQMTVLPRPEPIFRIRHVDPDNLNSSMRRTRNLIFAFTLDDGSVKSGKIKRLISAETLRRIEQDTSIFMSSLSDVYARGQEVVYLFGANERALASKINRYGQRIVDHFDRKERERLEKGLLNATTTKAITGMLEKDHHVTLQIPFGFRLADNQDDFVWLRQINPEIDKDVFIAKKKYTSQDDFKQENLIKFRNEICRKYLFEDPEQSDTYLVTETKIPEVAVQTTEFNFNNQYAVEMKGLWKTNVNTMGGPFMGFAMVDESRGDFYYIEGFAYSPSKDQREIMRELETILFSFRIK